MNIIVLIKQVPEMEKVKFDTTKGVIDRKSAGVEINPFDLNALEAAVEIKETVGGKITAISMGPARAEKALKEAIARGADEGILLTDRQFAGADTIATSAVLAAACRTIGDFDLITAGEMTVDGDTAQVGPQTAEFLALPHIAYVTEIEEITGDKLEVVCNVWEGNYRKRLKLPGLITATKDLNTPRLPSFKDKMAARRVEIKKWSYKDIEKEFTLVRAGSCGSPTAVKKIVIPEQKTREGKVWREDSLDRALKEIYRVCREVKQ